ncbi:MAG: glycosyltransferase family 2 protein [Candidatus Pacebacteria bacterium]|nr:glycosyltransferase family 2 protein [Candidatus Paceibacterota bacterium]
MLISFFENKEEKIEKPLEDSDYLSVTIMVPCYNEESTVERTIKSLQELDYPIDKLNIMIIDDGSIDNTWNVVQQFRDDSRIILMQKENEGSKFAALNFALAHIDTELVGVLDADSWVSKNALVEYMYFFRDKEVMATIPSMVIGEPNGILQKSQKAEYDLGLFARKAFSNINAIYITPGPFSVFRKYVFDTLGPYKEAHHTEDAEIALRMQKHHYKIAYSEKSVVYTVPPNKVKPLIKQRVRWVYGFIRNVIDYKGLFFKKEYKELGTIILPIGVFRVFITVILFPLSMWLILVPLLKFLRKILVVGYNPSFFGSFDWFFVGASQIQIFTIIGFFMTIFTIWIGRELIFDRRKFTIDIVYMLVVYTFIAPIWLIKASWNALRSKKESWR